MSSAALDRARRPGSRTFVRFCCVGAAGFVADTAVLLALVHGLGLQPVAAKVLSFAVAVLVTFELNRRFAFERQDRAWAMAFGAYLAVQGVGFLCNWSVFTLSVTLLPGHLGSVLPSAVLASVAALFLNFLGASRFVFAR